MSAPTISHTFPSGATIRVVQGDITSAEVEAIVNAANTQLQHGGGVAAATPHQGGSVIQEASDDWVRQYGPISPDHPAITPGGALPCRFVIHAVGPVWGEGDEDDKLRRAALGALRLASDRGITTLALPAISTGIFGFPKERAAGILLDALADYFGHASDPRLCRVDVTLFDAPTFETFSEAFHQRWPG